MNKTMLKLVWSLVAIVLLAGVMRLVMLHDSSHSADDNILIRKSK